MQEEEAISLSYACKIRCMRNFGDDAQRPFTPQCSRLATRLHALDPRGTCVAVTRAEDGRVGEGTLEMPLSSSISISSISSNCAVSAVLAGGVLVC